MTEEHTTMEPMTDTPPLEKWKEVLEYLLSAGRASRGDVTEVQGQIIDLELQLIQADFGFSPCQEGAQQRAPNSKTCMEHKIAETVERYEWDAVSLKEVVFTKAQLVEGQGNGRVIVSRPEHVVYRAVFRYKEHQQLMVHAYHFCNTAKGEAGCPHNKVRTTIGDVACEAVVPVWGYVWGARSRVLWVIEPLCELPDHLLMNTPGFQRSQIDLMKRYLPVVGVLHELQLDEVLLHHGEIRYRQRFFDGPSPLLVDMRYSSIYAETFEIVFGLWSGRSHDGFCFQKSDANFRQLCRTADRDVVDKVVELMHNWTGRSADSVVTWEAFYRSVQLFGYWWRTKDLDRLKTTLKSFFASREDLGRIEAGTYGFRSSETTPHLVACAKGEDRSTTQILIAFDAATGKFYVKDHPEPQFMSPVECVECYSSALARAVPSVPVAAPNHYVNKGTGLYANK